MRSLSITNAPRFGSVSVNNDGSLVYTPNLGFVGVDVLTYKVADLQGLVSNTATATFRVSKPRVLVQDIVVPTTMLSGIYYASS